MSTIKNKTLMFGMLMLLSAFALGGNSAFAAGNNSNSADSKDVCAETDTIDNEQNQNDNEVDTAETNDAQDVCEKAESAKLASQAKISEVQARKVVENNYTGSGKITEIRLGNDQVDNGVSTIVYEIEITETSGNKIDVKVDAMTGKYLGVDIEDGESESGDTEAVKGVNGNANIQALQMQLMSLLQQLIALLKS